MAIFPKGQKLNFFVEHHKDVNACNVQVGTRLNEAGVIDDYRSISPRYVPKLMSTRVVAAKT